MHCCDARSMSCWQKVRVFSVCFTQPFQYFQIVNLVDCLSSWYKFIMNIPSNIKFANFIIRPCILDSQHCQYDCLLCTLSCFTFVLMKIVNNGKHSLLNIPTCFGFRSSHNLARKIYITQIYITIIQSIKKGALPQTYIGVVKENCPQNMYKYLALIIKLLVVDDGLRC